MVNQTESVVPYIEKNMEECKDQLLKEDPDKMRENIATLRENWPRRMKSHQSQSRRQM